MASQRQGAAYWDVDWIVAIQTVSHLQYIHALSMYNTYILTVYLLYINDFCVFFFGGGKHRILLVCPTWSC